MPRIGEPAGEGDRVEVRPDAVGDDDAAERHVARVDALREGDEVGGDVEVLEPPPGAQAAEADHDLVGDVDDAVAVAQFAHTRQVSGRRDEHAVCAHDRLDDDRPDRRGPLEDDRLFEVRECALGLLLGRVGVERRAVVVGAEEVHDRRVGGLVGPAARVSRQGDRRRRVAVVAAVHREHLALARDQARHAHGVLIGIRPAVREEHLREAVGRDLADEPGEFAAGGVRHRGLDRREPPRLLLDRRDEIGVLVAEVEVHQLRREVEVAVAGVVPEGRAGPARDRQGIDEGLRAPRVEDVPAVVGADGGVGFRVGDGSGDGGGGHGLSPRIVSGCSESPG